MTFTHFVYIKIHCVCSEENMYRTVRSFVHYSTMTLIISDVFHVSKNVQIEHFKTGRRSTKMQSCIYQYIIEFVSYLNW